MQRVAVGEAHAAGHLAVERCKLALGRMGRVDVEAEAGGEARPVRALQAVGQTFDRGQDLQGQVVLVVDGVRRIVGVSAHIVGVKRALGLVLGVAAGAKHVGNDVAAARAFVFGEHAQSHLHMRLVLGVGVVLGPLAEALVYDVVVERDASFAHVRRELLEVLVNALDHRFGGVAGEDLFEHVGGGLFRERAVFAPLHVETLDLGARVAALVHQQRRVLFLLEEEHALKDAVNVDLQQAVSLIDRSAELVAELDGRIVVHAPRIDHDTVRVAVNHVEGHALGELARRRQNFSALERRERREWPGIEPRVFVAQAPIHTVRREFERLLLDIPLELLEGRRVLVLHERLDLPAAIHERGNQVRQHTLRHVRRRRGRHIVAVALDRRKVNVELLDNAGIQRIKVHHQDVLVPQPTLGLKDETSLELFLLVTRRLALLVGAEVLFLVELVQQDVFVALGAATVQRA